MSVARELPADSCEAVQQDVANSRLFAAVSHDLRQGVHAIALHLVRLIELSKAAGDESTERAVQGIRESLQALDELLSQVLDLTRMDSYVIEPDVQPIELAALVRGLVARHSAAAELAGVRIVTLVKPGRAVRADKLMLQRVIANLLDNAIAASSPGASVVVALRYAPHAWRVQIRDSGAGIAEDALGRIFEELVQLDAGPGRPARGLGLAICKHLVHLMNGSIAVRSARGRGCCMTVALAKAPPA